MTPSMTISENLERQLEQGKQFIERKNAALRLSQNPDFKKLIVEGFMRDDAARLVAESADPILSAQERADALSMAQAAGHLKRFLNVIIQMGTSLENDLPNLVEAIEEARAEEAAEGIV